MIRTQDDTFYIQPIPSHLVSSNEFDGHPHVVYRKSTEEDLSSDHHVSGKRTETYKKLMTIKRMKLHFTDFLCEMQMATSFFKMPNI